MSAEKTAILLAEDDASLAIMISDTLEDEGYTVTHCADGKAAVDIFDKNKFDICLLDIMMPKRDGYFVAKKIREQSDIIPILFLSTKNEEDDKLKGYDTGADDYISKPFSMPELLKKISVFLRRTKKRATENEAEIRIGNIEFMPSELRITTPVQSYKLTQKEADLLSFFCNNKNKIVKRADVLLDVWGKDDFFLGRSMDVYMTKLRKYLKDDEHILLETIHGLGFRLSVL